MVSSDRIASVAWIWSVLGIQIDEISNWFSSFFFCRRRVRMITVRRCCLLAYRRQVCCTLRCQETLRPNRVELAILAEGTRLAAVPLAISSHLQRSTRSTCRLIRIAWCATSSTDKSLPKKDKPLSLSGANWPPLWIVYSFGCFASWLPSHQPSSSLSYLVTIADGLIPNPFELCPHQSTMNKLWVSHCHESFSRGH